MPFVNSKTEGTQFAFPDVCSTPSQSDTVPVPYPTMASLPHGPAAGTKVKIQIIDKPALARKIPKSMGDTAGVHGGVASGMVMGPAAFAMGGTKVKTEGATVNRAAPLVNAPPNGVCGNPECRFHEHAIPATRLATLPAANKVAFDNRVVCLECYNKLVGNMPKPAPFTQDTSTDSLTGLGVVPSQVKVLVH